MTETDPAVVDGLREELWRRLQHAARLADDGRRDGWLSVTVAVALDACTEEFYAQHFETAEKGETP